MTVIMYSKYRVIVKCESSMPSAPGTWSIESDLERSLLLIPCPPETELSLSISCDHFLVGTQTPGTEQRESTTLN